MPKNQLLQQLNNIRKIMFFKVVQNKQVHIYNPKEQSDFSSLQKYIKSAFKKLPQKYQLCYIDQENDQITLANEQDFRIMAETANKTVKIFVKEVNEDYYDQTQHVVLDDEPQQIQPLLVEEAQHEEHQNQAEKPQIQEPRIDLLSQDQESKKIVIGPSNIGCQKVFIEQSKFNLVDDQQQKMANFILDFNLDEKMNEQPSIWESQFSQATESMIEQKLSQLLPNLIKKVKAQILKESTEKTQVKEEQPRPNIFKKLKPVHQHITCDKCGKNNIEGVRYKCSVCDNFDVCQVCEINFDHPHPFLKIKTPEQAPLKIVCIMNDQHDSFEINGKKLPFPHLNNIGPFLGNLFNLNPKEQKNSCPFFNKTENKSEQKKEQKIPETKVEEKKVQQKKVEEKKVQQKKVEQKKVEEKKVEQKKVEEKKVQQTNDQKIMENAIYLSEVLDIDYNRCYKFAQKNQKLSKEEILELYFTNPKKI